MSAPSPAVRFNGTDLHLVAPLRFGEPVVSRESWDVVAVDRAFGGELADHLQPFGQ